MGNADMRRVLFIGLGMAALLMSFFVTLRLIEPDSRSRSADNTPPDIVTLAAQRVLGYSDVEAAARQAGLTPSSRMRGVVGFISRVNEGEVAVNGWLADPENDGTPLKIVVFLGGSVAA